jgi:hypothetical protein
MADKFNVDRKLLRVQFDEMAAEVVQVRRLIEGIPHEQRVNSPWPSGRNLWQSVLGWLEVQRFFLQVIENKPRDEPWSAPRHGAVSTEMAFARWDECRERIKNMMESYADARWNEEVDFWADTSRTRRLRAWEIFAIHFADILDIEWVWVKEDLVSMGLGKDLIRVTGNPAAPYRQISN